MCLFSPMPDQFSGGITSDRVLTNSGHLVIVVAGHGQHQVLGEARRRPPMMIFAPVGPLMASMVRAPRPRCTEKA